MRRGVTILALGLITLGGGCRDSDTEVVRHGADVSQQDAAAASGPDSTRISALLDARSAQGGAVTPGGRAASMGSTGSAGAPNTAPAPFQDQPVVSNPAANEILTRAEHAYEQVRSMEADFEQDVYVPLTERNYHSRGKIFHRAPDRFLMRFSDPQGDVVVVDGRKVWMYYPSTDPRQVTVFPLSPEGQQADLYREFLSNSGERYVATRSGADAVAGRPAQGLTLVPRGDSPYKTVRLWVDDQDSMVRRFEITEENGTVRKIQMSGLKPNVSLADALFQFTPPAGVQVHEF